ncbi:MAG: hypothetical protein EZS28_003177 [Streblomastix strix]|uniref:Uncharacterized protein n=1 Tax=Streblomastix strix TaxID=222440 RepID=A0A5J4X464_9EUKA|nr:MAG: hypothetical protein EZS28_003177 [Streblomastix strix]
MDYFLYHFIVGENAINYMEVVPADNEDDDCVYDVGYNVPDVIGQITGKIQYVDDEEDQIKESFQDVGEVAVVVYEEVNNEEF